MSLRPIGVEEAKRFVAKWHRHNPAPIRALFAAAVVDQEGSVRGVALATHPTSRGAMDGYTCEINRVATDGARNACSMLYGAVARAAKALGYRVIITYTLASEGGASLRAAGFVRDEELRDRSWTSKSRLRIEVDLLGTRRTAGPRVRWVRLLSDQNVHVKGSRQ